MCSSGIWVPAPPPGPPIPTKLARVRRRRRLLIIFAAIACLTASTSARVFLGVRHEDNHWTPLYNRAVTELSHRKSDSEERQAQTQDLQKQLQDLQERVAASVGNLNKSHFVLWNDCGARPAAGCPLRPGHEYVIGVPDKFSGTDPAFQLSSTEAESTFECWLDAGAFLPCSRDVSYSGLSRGRHTFFARAMDAAGNVDPTSAQVTFRARRARRSLTWAGHRPPMADKPSSRASDGPC